MNGTNSSNGHDLSGLEELLYRLASNKGIDPEKTIHIFRLLLQNTGQKGLSDEDLESLTGYRQGEIRKVLRLFYEIHIASYRRGRHPETGATRYYWKIDVDTININMIRRKKAVLEKLKKRLEYEEGTAFYRCPNDGSRYTFDEAFEYDFTCPKCGSILEEDDNRPYIEILRSTIKKLEEEIKRDEAGIYTG
ncbi:MAG: transcription factor [Desulfurococcales archaeon]|nr:transcription factor [Desulfurococcales archaeon]MCE4605356.1 transcription factor [Desulfurococcales archaeon]